MKRGFQKRIRLESIESVGSREMEKFCAAAGTQETAGHILRIFHINDVHAHLQNHGKIRHIVSEARKNAAPHEAVLFFSLGDDHTGTFYDELNGWDEKEFTADPAWEAATAAGVDAAVLGNHDVDRGFRLAAHAMAHCAGFPVLSANLAGSRHLPPTLVPPALACLAAGLKIGLIGITTPEETRNHPPDDPDAHFLPPLEVLDGWIDALEDKMDLIIVLSHLGYEGAVRHRIPFGDQQLAKAIAPGRSIPIIIAGGHSHSAINASSLTEGDTLIDGIPILQAGSYGEFLGEFSARLTPGDKGMKLEDPSARLIALDDVEDSEESSDFRTRILAPYNQLLEERRHEALGPVADSQHYSLKETLESRYMRECAMADFICDAVAEQVRESLNFVPDIVAFNASGIVGGLVPGKTATYGDWFSVLPYTDEITALTVSEAELFQILQSNAKRIVRPGELEGENPVDLSDFVSRGFLHFSSNLRCTIRLGRTAADASCENISLKNRPLGQSGKGTIKLLMTSYIAGGLDGWNGFPIGAGLPPEITGYDIYALPREPTGLIFRNEALAWIRRAGRIGPVTGTRPLDGRLKVL